MRYRRLDLNLLLALHVLLMERSVTRAAARLSVTQPAMSGSLARLRGYFGDPLIQRVGQTMELTPLARALIGPIRDIMRRIDVALATDPGFDPATSSYHFTLSASDYVSQLLLHDVLREASREAPGITFEILQTGPRSLIGLDAGEIDMVIVPEIDTLATHPREQLFVDSYRVVCWRDSQAIGKRMSFEQYIGLGHVVFRCEHQIRTWLERWFIDKYGDFRKIEVATHSHILIAQAVVGTDRIATLPTRLASELARTLPLRLIKPPLELPRFVGMLQWPAHRAADPANRWLRERIRTVAQRLPPV
jgi:DNA-binding transcriptional LysR family regulator